MLQSIDAFLGVPCRVAYNPTYEWRVSLTALRALLVDAVR
jgi:hypothetical protein